MRDRDESRGARGKPGLFAAFLCRACGLALVGGGLFVLIVPHRLAASLQPLTGRSLLAGSLLLLAGAGLLAVPSFGRRANQATLKARLAWLLTAAITLPAVLAVGVLASQVERLAREEDERRRRLVAEAGAKSVFDAVEIHRREAAAVAVRASALPLEAPVQEPLLAAGRDASSTLDTLLLFDADGRLVARHGATSISQADLAFALGDPAARGPFVGRAAGTQRPCVWSSSPVAFAGLPRPGTLVSVLRPAALTQRLYQPDASAVLGDGSGQVIAEARVPSPSIAGEPATAVTVPGLGWLLEVANARGGTVEAVREGRDLLLLLLLLLLPLAALTAPLFARRLVGPVGRLADTVEEMTDGLDGAAPADSAGEVTRISASFRELRERLARRTQESERLATELRARAEALADSDRRKNEFLAMLAHELRNPIGAISTASYVLAEAGAQGGPTARPIAIIQRQIQHLSRLVDDLLDVSRITRGTIALKSAELDLGQIVTQSVEACLPAAEAKQQSLILAPPPGPLPAFGDGIRLEQVFSNLIRNAIKFTPNEGKVWVTFTAGDGEAAVSVRDEGIGIPKDLAPRIFDLFVQGKQGLDRSVGGLGIGLTLVRSLVEMHGGRIEVKSGGDGQGSEFIVHLPLVTTAVGPTDLDSSAVWAR
jgi:signal transduction histidine kinase